MNKLPIVGVMGSGTAPWTERAAPLGVWLAGLDVHLLTGGGGGVMAAVGEAFVGVPGRRGLHLGVLPGDVTWGVYTPTPGYPNPFVEVPIRTHLPHRGERGLDPASRNHLNVLSADVLVALPGGPGTATECKLALRYGAPLIAWVEAPDELPGLPPELPTAAGLADVQAFVRESLARNR